MGLGLNESISRQTRVLKSKLNESNFKKKEYEIHNIVFDINKEFQPGSNYYYISDLEKFANHVKHLHNLFEESNIKHVLDKFISEADFQ